MAKELLPDALWARMAPLLPPEPPKPKGGRPGCVAGIAPTAIIRPLAQLSYSGNHTLEA